MISALFLPILILVLFLLRQNLIVILGVATAYAYWAFGDGVISNIVVDAWDAANKDILLSIPLFILAGNIMSRGGMASRLIDLMTSLTAPIPGGLAIATIMSCAAFAAVSGSGTVTLLAIGTLMYPALIKAGYPKNLLRGIACRDFRDCCSSKHSADSVWNNDANQLEIVHSTWSCNIVDLADAYLCCAQNFSHREDQGLCYIAAFAKVFGLIDASHYSRRNIQDILITEPLPVSLFMPSL